MNRMTGEGDGAWRVRNGPHWVMNPDVRAQWTGFQAANLANFAAGLVVMKSGTATTTRGEILDIIERADGMEA